MHRCHDNRGQTLRKERSAFVSSGAPMRYACAPFRIGCFFANKARNSSARNQKAPPPEKGAKPRPGSARRPQPHRALLLILSMAASNVIACLSHAMHCPLPCTQCAVPKTAHQEASTTFTHKSPRRRQRTTEVAQNWHSGSRQAPQVAVSFTVCEPADALS